MFVFSIETLNFFCGNAFFCFPGGNWGNGVAIAIFPPSAILQDGRYGGVTTPEPRWLKWLKGGVGDGGEPQWRARHPGDIVQAAWLLITWSCMRATGGEAEVMRGWGHSMFPWYGRKLKHNNTDVFYERRGCSGGFVDAMFAQEEEQIWTICYTSN